jgi:hypothetical protein
VPKNPPSNSGFSLCTEAKARSKSPLSARLNSLLKNSFQALYRRLKPAQFKTNKDLIGTNKFVP